MEMEKNIFLEESVEKLEQGDITQLRIVYECFGSREDALVERAGKAIAEHFKTYSVKQMLCIEKRFQNFTSLNWYIDWAKLDIASIHWILGEEQWKYFLILGTFHPNGYFRERCTKAVSELSGVLPYLLIRVNDWVSAIRETACSLVIEYIEKCDKKEIMEGLPAFARLENSGRRSQEQYQKIDSCIKERLFVYLKNMEISEIQAYDFSVRKIFYQILIATNFCSLEQLTDCLKREKLLAGKRILMQGILTHQDCRIEDMDHFLTDKSAYVRKAAVEWKYEHLKDAWPGLSNMLLDRSFSVRDYAVYILEKRSHFPIRDFYLSHLSDEKPENAILGLAEYSHQGNLEALLPCLKRNSSGKVVKSVLLALGKQEDFDNEELLWYYLVNERIDWSKAAYLSIRKRGFCYQGERLYQAYVDTSWEHVKRYTSCLLFEKSYWEKLPWVLLLYDDKNFHGFISKCCFPNIFCWCGKLNKDQKEKILWALEQKKEVLPKDFVKSILFSLKFI